MFASPQINIYSQDVERGVDFYRGLGFEETFRTPSDGEPDHVVLGLDGFILGVASTSSVREVHGVEPDGDGGA